MCGILFSSRRHTCTATWQLQRAVCWWGVHGWIKTSRLKPQAVQPRLIPLDKVPVRHSRQHLSKSLIYSSPLLHYPSTCPLMGRTALFHEALTFTQACNSTTPDNGWNLMGKNRDVIVLPLSCLKKTPQHPNYWKSKARPAILCAALTFLRFSSRVKWQEPKVARQNCAREPVKLQVLPQFLKVVCESISVYPDETLDDCTGLNLHFCYHQYQ